MAPKLMYNPDKEIPELSGTAGVGKQTILALSKHGPAAIYFTGRNQKNATTVINEVRKIDGNISISFIRCDQTSLTSVYTAADEFLAASSRLDVLICNAGVMAVEAGTTQDGYEIQFGTNHVSHSLFVRKLLPLLEATQLEHGDARVVILSSLGFKFTPPGGITFDALKTPQPITVMGRFVRYGQSKLANVLYASEIARRYKDLMVIAIHPGVIHGTELGSALPIFHRAFSRVATYGQEIQLHEGAYNSEWAATTSRTNLVSGSFYEPVGSPIKPTKDSSSEPLREKLWMWTQKELDEFEAASRDQD